MEGAKSLRESGGADEIRTHDLCIANAALSQLSYSPTFVGYLSKSKSLSQQESSPVFTRSNKRISHTAIIFRPSQLNTKSIISCSRYLITPFPAILIITPFYRHVLLINKNMVFRNANITQKFFNLALYPS